MEPDSLHSISHGTEDTPQTVAVKLAGCALMGRSIERPLNGGLTLRVTEGTRSQLQRPPRHVGVSRFKFREVNVDRGVIEIDHKAGITADRCPIRI